MEVASRGSVLYDAEGENIIDFQFQQFEKYKVATLPDDAIELIEERLKGINLVMQPGAVNGDKAVDEKIRKSKISWLSDPFFLSLVELQFASANESDPDWQFALSGVEEVQYSEYEEPENLTSDVYEETFGGHYDWHNDHLMAPGDPRTCRKLSMTVMLDQQGEDFEGGDFQFACLRKGEIDYQTVRLNKGDILVFPSMMNHKVDHVLSGKRRTLVAWAWGPAYK